MSSSNSETRQMVRDETSLALLLYKYSEAQYESIWGPASPFSLSFLSGSFWAFFWSLLQLSESPILLERVTKKKIEPGPKKNTIRNSFWKVGLFRIDMKMHAEYFDLRDFSVWASLSNILGGFLFWYVAYVLFTLVLKIIPPTKKVKNGQYNGFQTTWTKKRCIFAVSAVFTLTVGFFGHSRNQSLFGSYFLKIVGWVWLLSLKCFYILQIEKRFRLFYSFCKEAFFSEQKFLCILIK